MLGSGNIANKKVYNTKGDHAVNANYIKKADYKTDDSQIQLYLYKCKVSTIYAADAKSYKKITPALDLV